MLARLHTTLAAVLCLGSVYACGSPVPPARLGSPGADQAQALYSDNGRLAVGKGQTVQLHGFNYFGFNNGQTMVDGLWGGPPIALDFATVVHRQKLLGFNAVRLPFSFKDLLGAKPRNFTQPCSLMKKEDIARSIMPAGVSLPASVPDLAFKPERKTAACNEYLPNDSVWNRYKYVVRFYAKNGFYVLIDNHLREDTSALDDAGKWAANYAKLLQELSSEPAVAKQLIVDVLNEPDQYGLRWEAQGGKPGLGDLYLKAMDAIHKVAPSTAFLIEGTGQGSLQANWGDGFSTDAGEITRLGLSDPRPFFGALVGRPYVSRVIIGPHVYGPMVTTNFNGSSGKDLYARCSSSFGYLTKKGFCKDGACRRFPVAIGEFGSKFEDPRDVQSITDFRKYLANTGDAADGKHSAIGNWFYWSWNANSGDTGGLVKDNWVDLQQDKLKFLQGMGLKPFYAAPAAGATSR